MKPKKTQRGGTELVDPLDNLLASMDYEAVMERPSDAFTGEEIIERIMEKHEVVYRRAASLRSKMVTDGLLKKELHKTYLVDGKRVKGTWFRVMKGVK